MARKAKVYPFGAFTIDLDRRVLLDGEHAIKFGRQDDVWKFFLYLAKQRRVIVPQDEILTLLWRDDASDRDLKIGRLKDLYYKRLRGLLPEEAKSYITYTKGSFVLSIPKEPARSR